MYFNVKKLNVINNESILVTFEDNQKGKVVIQQSWFTGVFEPLKDIEIFKKAFVNMGAVSWDVNGYILDLAPDTMYKEIKKNNGVYFIK